MKNNINNNNDNDKMSNKIICFKFLNFIKKITLLK